MSRARNQTITFGTRKSRLARWQTNHIIRLLEARWDGLECRVKTFETEGDKNIDQPLPEIGGKGLFTARLEEALRDGVIDVAVHSLKDLPTADSPGLTLGAITERADVRDVLVAASGVTMDTLPSGAVVGTSSIRRQAQLLRARPDLTIKPIRGNVETRVRKVKNGDYDAAVMAAAGIERLGLVDAASGHLSLDTMLPAPGQGALAVQCRADDEPTLEILAPIDDLSVREAVTAERVFLEGLGGGCSAPVAAYARPAGGAAELMMTGFVGSPDGGRCVRVEGSGSNGHTLGTRLAGEAIARGALELLAGAPGQALPLKNRRIVVTRAAGQAGDLCEALARLGAVALPLPTIRVVPVQNGNSKRRITEAVANADWAVFTSVNGVEAFWAMVGDRVTKGDVFERARVAAVGPATARALSERGVEPDLVPGTFTGEAIAKELAPVEGRRIVLLRAATAGQTIVETLTARGATVEDLAIYETVPEAVDAERLDEIEKGVDAIIYTSGSTARNLMTACRNAGRAEELVKRTPAACIGPVTAKTARGLGLDVRIVADEHTTRGLLDALVSYFNKDDSV